MLGATGTGKTFTIANIIANLDKPALILEPNKTLAGQIYSELKQIFPKNNVEYYISYYDYYQPEAYNVATDTYIAKDAAINDDIDQLRNKTISSLMESKNTIVVASVSAIYDIGDFEEFKAQTLFVRKNAKLSIADFTAKLVKIKYTRNDFDKKRGTFQVKGDTVYIYPANTHDLAIRVEFEDDLISDLVFVDKLNLRPQKRIEFITIYPATFFLVNEAKQRLAIERIKAELEDRLAELNFQNKLLEAQRLQQITNYDIEMIELTGTCTGIENYQRHMQLKEPDATPSTLLEFFGSDFITVVDESHITMPQVKGMSAGNLARKANLVEYGFRLPSTFDNRPLYFSEFTSKLDKVIYMSATPGEYEMARNLPVIEQVIRPTYIVDPEIEVREKLGQIDDLFVEIKARAQKNERTLVTCLTIHTAELLTKYFKENGLKVAYLHSKVKSIERLKIIKDLRAGKYDALVGINLLREGLDIPEVSLVAILDADIPGLFRSKNSLIQIIGRACRNKEAKVIMYADQTTKQMQEAIDETHRRREIQLRFNRENGVSPIVIEKQNIENIEFGQKVNPAIDFIAKSDKDVPELIKELTKLMEKAAAEFDFESAINFRDAIAELKGLE